MTQIGSVYGEALYALAKDEGFANQILEELTALKEAFRTEPDFLRLLSSPNLSKQERCQIIDDSFQGKIHVYILNFLKILTEKGYSRHFSDCCASFKNLYNHDNGILPVTAVTAVPLTGAQRDKLTGKLTQITGKAIELVNRVDPSCLGGMRLDYDGKQLDDTVAHRLEAVRSLLKNTVL